MFSKEYFRFQACQRSKRSLPHGATFGSFAPGSIERAWPSATS